MKFIKTRAFPSFYQDYAPKLIEFFGLWIDWLNEKNNSAYIIDHLSSERDIDESIDAYKTHIKDKILKDYPESIASDLKLLLKNIFYLYNAKSSIKSYDFLFRCLFNSPASISYPKRYMLRASDGRWDVQQCMYTIGENLAQSITLYDSWMIKGDTSGASAYINGTTDILVQKTEERSDGIHPSIVISYIDDRRLSVGQQVTIDGVFNTISRIQFVDGKYHISLKEKTEEISKGTNIILDDSIIAIVLDKSYCEFKHTIILDNHTSNVLLNSVIGVFLEGEHLTLINPETGEIVNIPDLCVGTVSEVRLQQNATNGQISSDMVIQDGDYYQDFSYIIHSSVSIHKWRTLVKTLIHPAGLQMFAELNLSGDVSDGDEQVDSYHLNAIEFLKAWKIMFQTCVFDVTAKMLYQQWALYRNSIAQRHSDTLDGWIHFYEKYSKIQDELEPPFDFDTKRGYCFSMIPQDDIDKQLNKNNILLFRDNGTLISPEIIQWATFEFLAGVDTNNVHGVKLSSQREILTGTINGSEWTSDEKVIKNNFMMFVTNKSSNRNNRVRDMILDNEYLKYDDNKENLYDYDVRHTTLKDNTRKYPNDLTDWKSLTIRDYIATSIDQDVKYDAYSLLKVPDNHISIRNDDTYVMEKYTYDNENLTVYSHSPEDFTHKIFVERLVDKVDVYYSKYKWFDIDSPKSPILNSNIKIYETKYGTDYTNFVTDLYRCESYNIVDGEEVQFQQSHYDLKLPYDVSKDNILLFVDGKYSNEYSIKDNILHIDSDTKNREISYYVKGGYISTDKLGKNIVYHLSHRSFFVNKNDTIEYYIRDDEFVSKDFNGTDVKYTVKPAKKIVDANSGSISGYLHTNGIVTSKNEKPNEETNKPIMYFKDNKFYYDKDYRKFAYYLQSNGNITKDEEGIEIYYKISNYTLIESITGGETLYWQANDNITSDPEGMNVSFTAVSCDVIHDFSDVVYFIQSDNSISTDLRGRDIAFFLQPDNTITSNNMLFDTAILSFGDCEVDSVVSISESESKEFGDFVIEDLVVTDLDDAKTTSFGDMKLKDVMYHIRGIKQDSVNTTIEVYLMSPIEAMRKQKTSYTNDRRFTYDSVINMPFAPSKHLLRWMRIVDMNDFFKVELGDSKRELTWFNPFYSFTEMTNKNKIEIFEPVQIQSETMDSHFGRNYTYKGSVDTIDDLKHIVNPEVGDLYNISCVIDDKTYPVVSHIIDDTSYMWNGEEWIEYNQKPMERLYNINVNDNDARYSIRSVDEILAAKNESSTLVFTDDGSLIYPELIDWHTKELLFDVGAEYLHSLPLMSKKPYKKVFVKDNHFDISEEYTMFFVDGKKIPQKYLTKTNTGWNISNEYSYESEYVYAFNYHDDFLYDYYEGNTNSIISIKDAQIQGSYSISLKDVSGDIMVEFSNGSSDRFSNTRFYQLMKEETSNDVLYNLTGDSILTAKKSEFFVNQDYIVVFVDGLYNTNFEYKTNGTIVLYETPKYSFEAFLLKPLSYNKPDVTRITDSYFTFDNLRIDNFASASESLIKFPHSLNFVDAISTAMTKRMIKNFNAFYQSLDFAQMYELNFMNYMDVDIDVHSNVKIKLGKLLNGINPTDLLFIKRLLKKFEVLEQNLDYAYHTKLNLVSAPNIMHHFTWDRLLMDGTQDVFLTQDYLYSGDLAEDKQKQLQETTPFDKVNYSRTITRDTIDENGNITTIEEHIFDRKKLGDVYQENSLYIVPDSNNPLVQTEVNTGSVSFDNYLSTYALSYDTGVNTTTTFGTQTANSILKSDKLIVGELDADEDITSYSSDGLSKIVGDFGNITANTMLDCDKFMLVEDALMDDFTTVSSYESKFNRYSTMLFAEDGTLVNPMLIDWPVTSFHLKHNMNNISTVCLNSNQPAIIGSLEKREFRTKLIGESNQLDTITLGNEDISSAEVQHLEMNDAILQSDMNMIVKSLGDVGIKNYFYYKVEGELLNALYAREDEYIPENVWLFINGRKVYKDDFTTNDDEHSYIIEDFDRYAVERLTTVDLGTLTEKDVIMGINDSYSEIGGMIDEHQVYTLNEDLLLEDIVTLSEVDNVLQKQTVAKEIVVFEYNPEDIEYKIEVSNPSTRIFELPSVGYTKDKILVFKNGFKTLDYYIAGDTLVLNANSSIGYLSVDSLIGQNDLLFGNKALMDDMISFDKTSGETVNTDLGLYNTNTPIPFAETVEIYVFKKLDYLMVDESKYNKNYKNFIIKNLKRSTYF